MKFFLLASLSIALLSSYVEPAYAISAPAPKLDVTPRTGSKIGPRAHILICLRRDSAASIATLATTLIATINDAPVTISTATSYAGSCNLLDVVIDSNRTGKLTLTYDFGNVSQRVTYTVAGKATPHVPRSWWWIPRAQIAGAVAPMAMRIPHSTVREVYQGLLLTVPTPALSMQVSWRRDSQSDWMTMRVPVLEYAPNQFGALLGESYSFQFPSIAMLNAGVQIRATAELLDGSTVDVVGLPDVVTLPIAKTIAPTP